MNDGRISLSNLQRIDKFKSERTHSASKRDEKKRDETCEYVKSEGQKREQTFELPGISFADIILLPFPS